MDEEIRHVGIPMLLGPGVRCLYRPGTALRKKSFCFKTILIIRIQTHYFIINDPVHFLYPSLAVSHNPPSTDTSQPSSAPPSSPAAYKTPPHKAYPPPPSSPAHNLTSSFSAPPLDTGPVHFSNVILSYPLTVKFPRL